MWPFSSKYPVKSIKSVSNNEYDFIIVGGGTSGCVLASRLTEDPNTRVLLLDRGQVLDSWSSRVPLLSSNFSGASAPAFKWKSAPVESIGGKTLDMVSGKAFGGTSAINGLLYTRSFPAEYDAWADSGRKGWSWKDVEPYFIKSETYLTDKASPHRGHQGPWKIQRTNPINYNIIKESIEAAAHFGFPLVASANDPSVPVSSCARLDASIDRDNHRSSTFKAFIPRQVAIDRKANLHICPSALVCAIDVQDTPDGPKAVGVTFENEAGDSDRYHVCASREVILCAGAIGTPQLLLLSGIGPAKDLNPFGIRVVVDLPGVGAHLQDHASVPILYSVPLSDSIEGLVGKPLLAIQKLLEYVFTGRGPFGSQVQQANIVFQSNILDENCYLAANNEADSSIPDVEIMPLPVNVRSRTLKGLPKSHGVFSFLCAIIQPQSFGSLRLTSIDPRDRPACDLGFLSAKQDYAVLRRALRLSMALGHQMRQNGYPLEPLWVPESASDEALDGFIKRDVDTVYHYSSTCRMAPENDMGVVDDELRVHGVRNLSIADASVFPSILACHLQAPVVMVGERCADFLKKRYLGALA